MTVRPNFITEVFCSCFQFLESNSRMVTYILRLSFYLFLGLPSGLFPAGFMTKILYAFSYPPCMLLSPRILSSLIPSCCYYLVNITNYETPHNAVFSRLLLHSLSEVQIFSSNILNFCSSLMVRNQVSHPYLQCKR